MSDADNELFELLRTALESDTDSDEDLIDMIMTGYDLTASGARVVEAIERSELANTRSSADAPRFWTCTVDDLRFDFELAGESVVGSIVPVAAGRMILHQPDGIASVELSETGSFEVTRLSDGPFRLYYQPSEGEPVATGWILP